MNCAKVLGKTYSKFFHPSLTGVDIKIIQVINPENNQAIGKPFFAADPLGVAIGELVAYEESFQATWAFEDHMIPVDRCITAIIDSLDIEIAKGDKNDTG
jgi:microcompartment protein CcmK/EutM